MDLIIDIGNTRVKAAVFKEEALEELLYFSIDDFKLEINKIALKYKIKHALIAAVGQLTQEDQKLTHHLFKTHILNTKSILGFTNHYATPKTLGVDRIALAAAAVNKYPDKNVLIIDAGTCITYDFVTRKKEYLGGAISPGVRSRYKSLHDYTENLPLLQNKIPKSFIGDSTDESLHSGVVNGICREIDGVISQYRNNYGKLTIVLTGGDAKFLSSQLKSSIFVAPLFLLEGLYTILKNNKQ
jgi:type III pantothenate kinase